MSVFLILVVYISTIVSAFLIVVVYIITTTLALAFLAASASAAMALCRFSGTLTSFTCKMIPHEGRGE